MPFSIEEWVFANAYHEAGHVAAIENRGGRAEVTLSNPKVKRLDSTTFIRKWPQGQTIAYAEIALSGPIAEALAMYHIHDPSKVNVQIRIDGPGIVKFMDFGGSVFTNRRLGVARWPIKLHLVMNDGQSHGVNVAYEDYNKIPSEDDDAAIAVSVQHAVIEMQKSWDQIHLIATELRESGSYSTGSFKTYLKKMTKK